jgi:uracil DNA glycosylase
LDFINLELSDTNIVDHHTHSYNALGLTFSVQPAREAPDSIW